MVCVFLTNISFMLHLGFWFPKLPSVKGHRHVPERGITGLARWSNQVVVAAQWISGVEQKVRWGISHVLRWGEGGLRDGGCL